MDRKLWGTNGDDDKSPLPEPNVVAPMSGEDIHTEAQVRGILCNPIYAGVGPFPALVDSETWVRGAAKMVREDGAEQFLVNLLFVLKKSTEGFEVSG